jgi:DeoR/GlpR family transcriptional regulator of sugar metabolism
MDGSRIGRTSLYHYGPVSDFTDVVITDDVSPEVITELREQCTVHIARQG